MSQAWNKKIIIRGVTMCKVGQPSTINEIIKHINRVIS